MKKEIQDIIDFTKTMIAESKENIKELQKHTEETGEVLTMPEDEYEEAVIGIYKYYIKKLKKLI